MFQRLTLPGSSALFTVVAFGVAASIFLTVTWRALRMRRTELSRFSQLPFDTATPACHHEPDSSLFTD